LFTPARCRILQHNPYFSDNEPNEARVDQKKNVRLRRINRTYLSFNNREQEAINLYCRKYSVNNKSKFMREAILTEVLKRFDEDYPTLFEFEKPNLFFNRKR